MKLDIDQQILKSRDDHIAVVLNRSTPGANPTFPLSKRPDVLLGKVR